jgi:hypothetical protein
MKTTLFFIFTGLILLFSCTPDVIKPEPEDKLKYTIRRDTTGRIIQSTYFNEWGLSVTDSVFNANNVLAYAYKWEYNAKGKLTRWSSKDIPFFGDDNIVRLEEYTYAKDTVLQQKRNYFRGQPLEVLKLFYNNAGQHVLDSFFSSSNFLFWTKKIEYNNEGKLARETILNGNGDTLNLVTYAYSANKVETRTTSYTYNPFSKSNHLTVTDFTGAGKILSELSYNNSGVNYLRTIYTYDASGHLRSKHFTNSSPPASTTEERYVIGSNGKPVTMESYFNDRLRSITTFYYDK